MGRVKKSGLRRGEAWGRAKVRAAGRAIDSQGRPPYPMAHAKAKHDALVRISQAAEAAGVSKQTVEYYCMLGLIHPIQSGRGRGRFFDPALVKRIALIHRLNTSGYTLRSIRETYLRNR